MAFTVQQPDFDRSRKTGMTREHWKQAGKFLLEGVFRHVPNFDDPIALPKQPGKTYPQPDDPAWKFRSAEFEGLARTLMVAGPIIEDDPDTEVAGYRLRDYYANQILRATNPDDPNFVGYVTDLARQYKQPLFQQTAEGAAMVLGLLYADKSIWRQYTQPQRDQVARLLSDYVANRTNSHNWRFFNVMMASFLQLNGYEIDRGVLDDHIQNLMAYYAGDGWYRDMGQFDFYSCFAFQFYGPIWANLYAYQHAPQVAEIIEKRHAELMQHYPRLFGRDGHSLMWGRSMIYRCAASSPFPAAFLLRQTPVDAGWARRICSGNLLQFLTRDDVFLDGVPSLGFYREFDPLVQGYSCAASPFWLAKIFLALHLDEDSPFWSAQENDGEWCQLGEDARTTQIPGPGLQVTNYGRTGITELRSGKVDSKKSNSNYTRLAYNTALLWEDDCPQGATAMAYSALQLGYDLPFMANGALRFIGEQGGVLYRQTDLPGWLARVDLAEVPLPCGTLRLDRVSIPYSHELHLGHYALPHVGKAPAIERLGENGVMVMGDLRKVILVALRGWDGVDVMEHTALHPEAEVATVAYAHRRLEKDYAGMYLAVTVMLHGAGKENWTAEDFNPVAELEEIPWTATGHPLGARLKLKDGREFEIDFGHAMGELKQ